jgi:hypothetical protein
MRTALYQEIITLFIPTRVRAGEAGTKTKYESASQSPALVRASSRLQFERDATRVEPSVATRNASGFRMVNRQPKPGEAAARSGGRRNRRLAPPRWYLVETGPDEDPDHLASATRHLVLRSVIGRHRDVARAYREFA